MSNEILPFAIVRPYPPQRSHKENYGARWIVHGKVPHLFIQCSEDKTSPDWIPFDELLKRPFREKFEDDEFLDKCFALIEPKKLVHGSISEGGNE